MQNLEKSPKLSHALGSSKATLSVKKRDKLGSSFYFNSSVSFSHACSHAPLPMTIPKRPEHAAHIKRDQSDRYCPLAVPFLSPVRGGFAGHSVRDHFFWKMAQKNEWLKNNNCLRSPTLPDRVCAIVFEQGSCTTLTSSCMELRWCICSAATRWMDRLAFPSVFVSFVYFILAKLFSFSSLAHPYFSFTWLH